METNIYNQKAEETGKINLPESVFGLPWNSDLVHQVVVAMTGNRRTLVAHTKTRGEVSGGGREALETEGFGQGQARFHPVSHLGGWRCCPRA